MAVFKCKMCGGSLDISNGTSIVACEYCGSQQTVPKLDDEKRINLYDRANHFRRNSDYDKAMSIYEQILNEDKADAEAYWSIVLCKYGIEYVVDPVTRKRVPTVNRTQFTSVFMDEDYKMALHYADISQKEVYEKEAKAIDEIQKGILEISNKEEPFDVFICYKESDENGRRTMDSVLANDLYHQLSQEGFKVFFARITLEDKLGSAYEPYIFAALNSARVMVVLGTRPEYFNAVWVKNEWSRYLALIRSGAKKILIPAYRDMDPYDLPEEFSHLQAQDMSKLGFMQDLIRGINKILGEKQLAIKEQVIVHDSPAVDGTLKRAFMFLEDGDSEKANEYFEKVLDINPECSDAYMGKLLLELGYKTENEMLKKHKKELEVYNNFNKALKFASVERQVELRKYIEIIKGEIVKYNQLLKEKEEMKSKDKIYENANLMMKNGKSERIPEDGIVKLLKAIEIYNKIIDWRDSKEKTEECRRILEEKRNMVNDNIYQKASEKLEQAAKENDSFIAINKLKDSLSDYIKVIGWKDTKKKMEECRRLIDENVDKIYEAVLTKINKVGNAGIRISQKIEKIEEAIDVLREISEHKNIEEDIFECKKKIEVLEKKKKRNRGLKLILCGIVIVYMISLYFIDFNVEGGKVTFRGYKYTKDTMQIPKRIFIWPVTYIDRGVYSDWSELINVELPESIVGIEESAFAGCSKIAEIKLPKEISYIGDLAFFDCSSLKEIVIPQGITDINKATFSGCTNLEKVFLSFGVVYIGESAFFNCYNLKEIELPNSISYIGEHAFSKCYGLKNVKLPVSLEEILMYTFNGCEMLEDIEFPEGLVSIGAGAFQGCEKLTNLNMPASLKTVESYAFKNCSFLETIEFHDNLSWIGGFAFEGCDNLKSITIESKGNFTAGDLGLSEHVVVRCYRNTPAAKWAEKYGLTVEWLD